jgi:ABC-type nitrate/sulfonate/bicarbonate transport system permease component
MRSLFRIITTALWLPLVMIVLWQITASRFPNPFFPPPLEIFNELRHILTLEFVGETVMPTVQLLGLGFLVGALSGVLAGTLIGSHEGVRTVLSPIIVFLRSTPTAAKVPVLLGILGIGLQAQYWAVGLAVFLNVAIVTVIGVARVPVGVTQIGRILHLSWIRQAFGVRLPAATGDVLTGLQAALQVAILVTVLVETLTSSGGLGRFLMESKSTFQILELWVGLALLGAIGVVFNEAFHLFERAVAPWYFRMRGRT